MTDIISTGEVWHLFSQPKPQPQTTQINSIFITFQLPRWSMEHHLEYRSQRIGYIRWKLCSTITHISVTLKTWLGCSQLGISPCYSHIKSNRIHCSYCYRPTSCSTTTLRQSRSPRNFLHSKQWLCNWISDCCRTVLAITPRICTIHLLNGTDIIGDTQSNRIRADGD